MTVERSGERTIPLHEEEITVGKRTVDRSQVRVTKTVRKRERLIEHDLNVETVDVQRVAINREVAEAPAIRQEGDVTIIPLVEEVVVVETRLVLREEVRIRKRRHVERLARPVTIRSEDAVVTRVPPKPKE